MLKRLLFLILLFTAPKLSNAQIHIFSETTNAKVLKVALPPPPPADTGWIFVLMTVSQSNGVGRLAHDAANAITVPPGVFEFDVAGDSLKALTEPTGQDYSAATGESLLSFFAKRLKDTIGRKIAVLKTAIGNTGIEDWRSPGYIDSYTKPRLDSFNAVMNRKGIYARYRIAISSEGENNVLNMDADQYIGELYDVSKYLYTIFPYDVLLSNRIPYDTTFTKNDSSYTRNIMKAQDILGKTTDLPRYVLAENQTGRFSYANGKKGTGSNEVHLTTLGFKEVGYDDADAAIKWIRDSSRIVLASEPEPQLALDGATDTITRYSNLLTGAHNWEFLFNGNIRETENDVSTRFRNSQSLTASPSFSSNKLVLDTNGYVLISRKFEANTFNFEWQGNLTGADSVDYFTTLTAPASTLGGSDNRIYYEWKTGVGASNYTFLEIKSASGEYRYWILGSSFNPTINHTYKIINDVSGNTLKLYIDAGAGVNATNGNAFTSVFDVQLIGAGQVDKNLNCRCVIDYVKMKDSL